MCRVSHKIIIIVLRSLSTSRFAYYGICTFIQGDYIIFKDITTTHYTVTRLVSLGEDVGLGESGDR